MSPGPARSSVPMRAMTTSPGPSSVAPVRRASSDSRTAVAAESVIATALYHCCRRGARLLVGERPDDLLGDVDPLAREHDRILQDEVELLRLGDLLDHLAGALL